jgi:hypothetical protein
MTRLRPIEGEIGLKRNVIKKAEAHGEGMGVGLDRRIKTRNCGIENVNKTGRGRERSLKVGKDTMPNGIIATDGKERRRRDTNRRESGETNRLWVRRVTIDNRVRTRRRESLNCIKRFKARGLRGHVDSTEVGEEVSNGMGGIPGGILEGGDNGERCERIGRIGHSSPGKGEVSLKLRLVVVVSGVTDVVRKSGKSVKVASFSSKVDRIVAGNWGTRAVYVELAIRVRKSRNELNNKS